MKKLLFILGLASGFTMTSHAQNTAEAQQRNLEYQRDSISRKSLSDAGATSSQAQQFMLLKENYGDSVKQVHQNTILTEEQKLQQVTQLNERKNARYLLLLGKQVYREYNRLRSLAQE